MGWGQAPAYFPIGLDQLGDKHIYDITQNKSGELLVATDQGVFKYDSYKIQKLTSSSIAETGSYLGFKKDKNGKVFCHNLQGQFFCINSDSIHLYYQLPDSLNNEYPSFDFNANNEMLILAKINFKIRFE